MEDQINQVLFDILGNFKSDVNAYAFSTLSDGYINDTYLVSHNEIPRYILQRINDSVFTDVGVLMNNISYALKHLDAIDYKKIELLHTISGRPYFSGASGHWRMMTYIKNSATFNTTSSEKIAYEAGRIIGKFHLLFKNVKTEKFKDTIPQFHHLGHRKKQFEEALLQASPEKLAIAEDSISFAKEMLIDLQGLERMFLPIRICHNDTKLNNILFDPESETALCLIDLDTLMKGHFYYDFGDAVRTIVNSAPEDEQEHHKITFEKTAFKVFIDGLASNGPFLSKEEIESLPLGTQFMPFIHGLRALTDFLNNNMYYKVRYENQNLDRCRSLFDFTKKAKQQYTYIEKVVEKLRL